MDTRRDAGLFRPPRRFNGATTFQPWIRDIVLVKLGEQEQHPSMEPRPFSHGYLVDLTDVSTNIAVLQWSHDLSAMDTTLFCCTVAATTFLQWSHDLSAMDTRHRSQKICRPADLQWSHDLSAMDTCLHECEHDSGHSAFNGATTFQPWIHLAQLLGAAHDGLPSMEPRPFSHGYLGTRSRRRRPC